MPDNPGAGWRELTALRRLADDVHTILTRATPVERGPVWDRLTDAYDRYSAGRLELGRDGRPLHRHDPTDYCAGLGCGCTDDPGSGCPS